MFRVQLKYEPNHPRMNGKCGGLPMYNLGAWRVVGAWPANADGIYTYGNYDVTMIMTATNRQKVGTLVNPRKLLAQYLRAKRAARVWQHQQVPTFLLRAAA